jgi:Mn-dependent DtxR family transcriptional regulator
MFSYQKSFVNPTLPVDEAQFWALVRATQWNENIDKFRETGDAQLKRKLPAFIFQATFDVTTSKSGKTGAWRKQSATHLTGLVVMDVDHIDDPLGLVNEKLGMSNEKWAALGVLLVYITPSGKGLKIVFKARTEWGNLIDNQHEMAKLLGVEVDESCKDASRMSFICKESDILYLDDELFTYENKAFGEKYDEAYRQGKSQPTQKTHPQPLPAKEGSNYQPEQSSPLPEREGKGESLYHGVPYAKIVAAWIGDKKIEPGDRHRTSLVLADHLRYITDNDAALIEQILRETPFVKEIIDERNEDVAVTVKSAQGYEFLKGVPRRMQNALKAAGAAEPTLNSPLSTVNSKEDVYDVLPLERWAEELLEMAEYYPCMKELFLNVHPHKLAAVWFSSAALFGTLMTRAWYHFWYEPELVRRLNYCIFIIGDPGAGKNIVEKFYKKIADPMIQADQCLIDAVNRYKEGRTERTTSTKAQKGEALKRPVVGIRVHPARTATGEFIRHMNAAVETVQGVPLNLHMFSFDAELDNVTKQNKGGDWKDREILELKAFHNEQDGQMYANQESVTGMFNVFWNFIYTGTPYALHRKVNQRNFGTGMSTRLAVIPLPDKGMAKRHQQVDPSANETLKTWAYRLDKVEGELPIEPLNDETFEWQTDHLEIAKFNVDKADRTLLKRIPYYGIGISLPFILMRHWEEWQEKKSLTMDDRDKRLCRLAMEIQYKCQQFFFGEMAFNYFADQNKEFVQRRRTTRYDECFRKLPDEFKTQQFMECFAASQPTAWKAINRFVNEGIVEKVKYGLYRKIVNELP